MKLMNTTDSGWAGCKLSQHAMGGLELLSWCKLGGSMILLRSLTAQTGLANGQSAKTSSHISAQLQPQCL